MHRVFDFIPQRRKHQRALDDLIEPPSITKSVEFQSRRHIVIDRHRGKRIGLLEYHADAAANLHSRGAVVDIHFADTNSACGRCFRDGLVHAVEATYEGGLSATRWSDYGGGVVGGDHHVDVVESLGLAEPGVQLVNLNAYAHISSLP